MPPEEYPARTVWVIGSHSGLRPKSPSDNFDRPFAVLLAGAAGGELVGAFNQRTFAVDSTRVNVEHLAGHAAELAFVLTQHVPLVVTGVRGLHRFVIGDSGRRCGWHTRSAGLRSGYCGCGARVTACLTLPKRPVLPGASAELMQAMRFLGAVPCAEARQRAFAAGECGVAHSLKVSDQRVKLIGYTHRSSGD